MTTSLHKLGWVMAALVSLAALAALTGLVAAGPLDPPGPPTTGTMKTLDQVEPRTPISSLPYLISSPGSYYLTSNLTGASGSDGITIAADNVSLDLSGFDLVGVPGSLDGVTVTAGGNGLSITNGTVSAWGGDGVDAYASSNNQYSDLRLLSNGGSGLVGGQGSTFTRIVARSNGATGVRARTATINDSTSWYNGGSGFDASYSVIRGSTAVRNGGSGIEAGTESVVEGCTVSENAGDGIVIMGLGVARGNLAVDNGWPAGSGAGVHVIFSNSRVEGNSVSGQTRGIDVDSTNNTIIQNDAGANDTNYDIVVGNTVGPIVTGPVDPITSVNPWANFSH